MMLMMEEEEEGSKSGPLNQLQLLLLDMMIGASSLSVFGVCQEFIVDSAKCNSQLLPPPF